LFPFFLALLFWNFVQTCGQGGLNTLITQVYPPRMRSTALGWAGDAGRVGGIIAPLYGAWAIAQDISLQVNLVFYDVSGGTFTRIVRPGFA
jgi:AAHS family 4-hydroxybenzoate transporter-like MFS transporter